MSQSLDSSLLVESSLTDSEDSASDCVCALSATCKRKRDCDSVMLGVEVEKKNFHHVLIACGNQPPYTGLAWDDTLLWTQIAEATRLPVISVLDCVSHFREMYDRDRRLDCLADSVLRTTVLLAFQDKPFEITKGLIDVNDLHNVRNTVIAQQPLHIVQSLPEPNAWSESSSEHVVGWDIDNSGLRRIIDRCRRISDIRNDKNLLLSYRITYADQHADDLRHLKLSSDEVKSMIEMYGPYSEEYMGMFNQPRKTRLEMLMTLLEAHQNVSSSSKSSVNTKRKKK